MVTVAEIMTRSVVTVSPNMPIRDVAALLAGQRFGSVPVIEADGRVLGIVSEEDMVTRAVEVHLPRHLDFLGGVIYLENPTRFSEEAEKILAMTARDIMDTDLVTARPDAPVEEVATQMLEDDVRRVLVLDDRSCLVGIVTRADIVRMLFSSGQLPEEHEGMA